MAATQGNGQVQSFFREVNERIALASRAFDSSGRIEILCECASAACTERLELDPHEFDEVRAHGMRFALVDGHEDRSAEEVVEARDGFVVVAKRS